MMVKVGTMLATVTPSFATDVEYIFHYAQERPDAPAVIVNNKPTSYRELFSLVCGFAEYLRSEIHLRNGDIVLVQSTQTLSYVILYYGVHLAGGIVAPVESTASGEGLRKIIQELKPSLIAGDLKWEIQEDQKAATNILNSDVCRLAESFSMKSKTDFTFPRENEASVIMFTTGTTGASKGVIHTQRSILATVENMVYACKVENGTNILTPGPMNHSGPIRKMVMAAYLGSAVILINGMKNMRSFFGALEESKTPIGCALVPSAVSFLLMVTGDRISEYAEKIDFIISDSAPLPEPIRERLCRLLPNVRLYTNYGSTEAGSVCSYNYNEYPGKVGCIGKANINSKIVTVDENNSIFKASKDFPGRLAVFGDVNMKGYWGAPRLTSEVLVNGMVCSSDIGYIDDEGFIYILGRQGDVINIGGLKVSPAEVEDMALRFPGVKECICVPVDDNISGKAAELLVAMSVPNSLDPRELRSFLIAHLENYKVPKQIIEVPAVPRTYNGKLDHAAAKLANNMSREGI